MAAYLFRRFLLGLLTIWIISVLSFLVIELPPGDSVDEYLQYVISESGAAATPGQEAILRKELGLNDPLYVRYGKWMWGLLRGDLGLSTHYSW